MVYVNCLNLDDPDHDPELRGHKGYHPNTMEKVSESLSGDEIRTIIKGIDNWRESMDPLCHPECFKETQNKLRCALYL